MRLVWSWVALLGAIAPATAFALPDVRLPVDEERLVLQTNRGDLVIALYPEAAPRTVEYVKRLVRLGAYDSTYFVRVRPGFVAQLTSVENGMNPLTTFQQAAIGDIPAELSALPHRRGTVSMARNPGDTESSETSFGIMLGPAPHLDGKFAVFGELESGAAVLAGIATEPRDDRHRPREPIVVTRALLRSPAALEQMRWAGELQEAFLDGPAADGSDHPRKASARLLVALVLLMSLSLLAYGFARRTEPRRVGALVLLIFLVGAFFLLAELLPRARENQLFAVAAFAAVLGLLKLMSQFEALPPTGSEPAPPLKEELAASRSDGG